MAEPEAPGVSALICRHPTAYATSTRATSRLFPLGRRRCWEDSGTEAGYTAERARPLRVVGTGWGARSSIGGPGGSDLLMVGPGPGKEQHLALRWVGGQGHVAAARGLCR